MEIILGKDQERILEVLKNGENVFITGRAGTGKTYLLNLFIKYLSDSGIPTGITASTGIAATHINGQTIHSWSGIGISETLDEKELNVISYKKSVRNRISEARVLIIDEVSMLHNYQLDMINAVCKKVRDNNNAFGGLQIVLCGDFFQLPPVSSSRHRGDFITRSMAWEETNPLICYLYKSFRHEQDNLLLGLLNEIRANNVSDINKQRLINRIDFQFPKQITPTRLHTHNMDAEAYNLNELDKINNPEKKYQMVKIGETKYVTKLVKNCLAPEYLTLKKGAVVMFLKNNFQKGYVNGTTGEVISFNEEELPVVRIYKTQKRVTVEPADWTMEDNLSILATLKQLPLKLAWAITIHKSQGMTLDYATIDLSKAFTSSLGYVALSRVRSLESLSLIGFNELSLNVSQEAIEIDNLMMEAGVITSSEIDIIDNNTPRSQGKNTETNSKEINTKLVEGRDKISLKLPPKRLKSLIYKLQTLKRNHKDDT